MNVGAPTQTTATKTHTAIIPMAHSTARVKMALAEMELHAKVKIANTHSLKYDVLISLKCSSSL